MAETVTTGTWIVDEAKSAAFVEAWADFATWVSSLPGAGTLRLGRDSADPTRFVSFAPWASIEAVHAWKSTPEHRERIARVLQHVEDFHNAELELVVSAVDGAATVELVSSAR